MKVEKLIPEVYHKESRDFAYVARLLEFVFNYMKTSADCVAVDFRSSELQSNIIELLIETLGFEVRHNYTDKDLIYIASAFNSIIRNKGNISAIELAIRLLLNSQGIEDVPDFDFCEFDSKSCELTVYVPDTLTDIILLEDLFRYILPAGVIYKINKFHSMDPNKNSVIDTQSGFFNGTNKFLTVHDADIGRIRSKSVSTDFDANTAPNIDDSYGLGVGSFYMGVVVTDTECDCTDPEMDYDATIGEIENE